MRIRGKTVVSGVFSVGLSILVTTVVILGLMRGEMLRQANSLQEAKLKMLHELVQQKGPPHLVDGKLLFGNYVVNGNYDVVDKLVEMAGGVATIFLGDTRVSTNVRKDDGSRAVGTPLVGIAKDIVLGRGQPYRGEADIIGVPYFTAYDPILDSDGRAIAVLLVAVKQDEFLGPFTRLIGTASGVAVVLGVLFAALIWYSAGRLLGRLSELAEVADAVSVGDRLDVPLESSTDDEVGDLAKAIDRLRESMRAALRRLDAA
jgi:methyl-accepting chemotaxis protein